MSMLGKEDFNVDSLRRIHQGFGLPEDEFYFKAEELECPHCGELKIYLGVYLTLMNLRLDLKRPVIITSGYRCPEYNRKIGGVPNSAHTKGLASDIWIKNSEERLEVVRSLLSFGVVRIGVAGDFVHFDLDDSKPSPSLWTYASYRHIA